MVATLMVEMAMALVAFVIIVGLVAVAKNVFFSKKDKTDGT